MAGTGWEAFCNFGSKGRQTTSVSFPANFRSWPSICILLTWIDTLLLKVWKSRLTLIQALLHSKPTPLQRWPAKAVPVAIETLGTVTCSCFVSWHCLLVLVVFPDILRFSAIFCRWTNSNLHSVAKHKHVRVYLRVNVYCSLGAVLHKYFIYFSWFYCLSLCQSDSHFTKRSFGEYGMVWLFLRVSLLISRFRSVLALHFFSESKILWSLQFKEIPNDCNGKFGTVCACCHVQKMLSTHMLVYVYVCHMFYSSLGWILVGVGWAPQKEVRWALGQRISPVVWIALSVERQKSCSCHVLIWQDIWWNLRLVQDLWPKCCVRCFELWSSWGKHPSRSGKQIGIWWGASRPANVRLGTSLIPTTDTK